MNDPFGEAIYDYYEKGKASNLTVNTNYTEDEQIPVSYLFRVEKDMPALEIAALKLCKGNILDVGAAAGCHSYILQKKGYSVTALEISEKAVEVLKKRGIQKVVQQDILKYSEKKYDTILLLMNGTGIGGTISGLKKLLQHLKTLLNAKGQILIDSSDIKYLFEEEDGSLWVDLNNPKYDGEMEYEITYKKSIAKYDWLFVDFKLLKQIANETGFNCEKVLEGDHFEYLAQLK
ncbi:MAG: class I SAM-dependent methyltransferase [Bacteroidales bacterium]|nr:class I SAM-dependent methyltransferase [Bacteroidales bacterium]